VLVDVVMPEMGGTEVARVMQLERPGLPVVFMSGYVGPTSRDDLDPQRMLRKPFTLSELASKIEEGFSSPKQNSAERSNVFPIKPGRKASKDG
jgi:CheY-like chemotaxis protein